MDVTLQPAELFHDRAIGILTMQRETLRHLGAPGELLLVGGSSVPGAVTRGDVDLHLRVDGSEFADTVALLRRALPVVHPEIWSPTLATFDVPSLALPTGLAVTPTGSEHDLRFTRTWQLLGADPTLIGEYNEIKRAGDLADVTEYERRKSAFFDRVLELWPTHPAGARAGGG